MSEASLRVALITDVFHGPDCPERLLARLESAKREGAELALTVRTSFTCRSPVGESLVNRPS